jgi:hypothetical protein
MRLRRSSDFRRRSRIPADFRRFDAAQGYYFSKPLPPDELSGLLVGWNVRARGAVSA